MAGTLLRSGLRSIISSGILERNGASATQFATTIYKNDCAYTWRKSQYYEVVRRMSAKRNVHRTGNRVEVSDSESSDSDGDDGSHDITRTESAFWRQKMRTLHSHLDVNKDGVVSYDDFMLLVERFSELGHLTPEAKAEFKDVLNGMWQEQWGEISPYNLICIEKYLESMHHVLDDKSLKKKCHRFLPYLFKAIDRDHSGEISVEEFKLFFQCLGLTHDDAIASFTHIDTNDDGKLSSKEFINLGRDFFLTQDRSRPSRYFWGPLVD